MSKPLRIDPEAEEELWAAAEWYEEKRFGLGHELLDAVDNALRRVQESPGASSLAPGIAEKLGVRRQLV